MINKKLRSGGYFIFLWNTCICIECINVQRGSIVHLFGFHLKSSKTYCKLHQMYTKIVEFQPIITEITNYVFSLFLFPDIHHENPIYSGCDVF